MRVNHKVGLKMGGGQMYVPKDELTSPVTRLKDDIADLMHLTYFKLPLLQVVRPMQVVQVFYGFGDASGKQLEQLYPRIKIARPGYPKLRRALKVSDSA